MKKLIKSHLSPECIPQRSAVLSREGFLGERDKDVRAGCIQGIGWDKA